MNPPWAGKSGLSKATAILATILGISLGLCGANFVAVMTLVSKSGTAMQGPADTFLTVTGITELVGIGVGVVGLLIVAGIAIFRSLTHRSPPRSEEGK